MEGDMPQGAAAKNGLRMQEQPCWVRGAIPLAQSPVSGHEPGSRKGSCKYLNKPQRSCRGLEQPQGGLPSRKALHGGHVFTGGSWHTVNLH